MAADELPLESVSVVVTRARDQAAELVARLESLGAVVIEVPAIEVRPAKDSRPLDAALAGLAAYDWVIFTSANGVRFFRDRLCALGLNLAAFHGKVCAIGPATRKAAERLGLSVDLMPEEYVAESLVEAFGPHDIRGKSILLPRAAVARDLVPAALNARGARVDVVEAYQTVAPQDLADRARQVFCGQDKPDWVTFTSSSTVSNLFQAAGAGALEGVRVASIGPVTTATLLRHGVTVAVEASPYTVGGLVDAILRTGSA